MAKLPQPEKPLKILTIDGGGLQGISTLLILDKLLGAIARNNGVPDRKPRPCDVFAVIAGIGPGGWLALLLGRFLRTGRVSRLGRVVQPDRLHHTQDPRLSNLSCASRSTAISIQIVWWSRLTI